MNAQRFWPTVQALGRTLVCNNRADIVGYSNRPYGHQSVGNPHFGGLNRRSEEPNLVSQNLLKTGQGSYVKIISRTVSTGTYYFCREFNDGENEHAHNVLCSLPAYQSCMLEHKSSEENYRSFTNLTSLFDTNWSSLDNRDLIESFDNLSKCAKQHSLDLADLRLHVLCKTLSERIPSMDDDLVLRLMISFSEWPPVQANDSINFQLLWNSLDSYCLSRMKYWGISKLFLVADHWYALRLSKISVFMHRLLWFIGNQLSSLSPTELVQFMFYANLNRDMGMVKSLLLKSKIIEAIDSISIEELGIIAMGLFKTQTVMEDDRLNTAIINMTCKNLDTISDHALGSILKFLNKGFPGHSHAQCHYLLDMLNPRIDKFNHLALLQIALVGNNLLVYHQEVMEKIGTRFGNNISQLRLKDIEKFTYTLMLYKFIPTGCPNVIKNIIEELRKPERIVEINHFPKCFVSCVNYLVTMGVFPLDLISAALQPSMLHLLQYLSSGNMGRELNEMNWSLNIEGPPNYPGFRLDPDLSQHLTKKYIGTIPIKKCPSSTHQERLLLDVKEKMWTILGDGKYLAVTITLPHFAHPDIIFCTDEAGEPLEIPSEYRSLPVEALKIPFDNNMFWNLMIMGGRNSFIRGTKELRGNLEMKRRQLQILGYRVSLVPFDSYMKKSNKHKLISLERILRESSNLRMDGRIPSALRVLQTQKPPPPIGKQREKLHQHQ